MVGLGTECKTVQTKHAKGRWILTHVSRFGHQSTSFVGNSCITRFRVGALSGLGSVAVNKAIGSGLYLKRGGSVCCAKVRGNGLYFTPGNLHSTYGNGPYLKHGKQFYDGHGLILGPNSPFKNIPLLGMLL